MDFVLLLVDFVLLLVELLRLIVDCVFLLEVLSELLELGAASPARLWEPVRVARLSAVVRDLDRRLRGDVDSSSDAEYL